MKQRLNRLFTDAAPCSLLDIYRRFRGRYCLHHHDHHSETSGNNYQTIVLGMVWPRHCNNKTLSRFTCSPDPRWPLKRHKKVAANWQSPHSLRYSRLLVCLPLTADKYYYSEEWAHHTSDWHTVTHSDKSVLFGGEYYQNPNWGKFCKCFMKRASIDLI
jgi:hypothetical protein